MGKPSDLVQLFTTEQAAAAFDGRADLTEVVIKTCIVRADTAAITYVNKGDYTQPWCYHDPANRGEQVLVPSYLGEVMKRLHEAWIAALLALEPGDRVLDPQSPEIIALQGLALNYTDKRLHREELRRWATLHSFDSEEFGAIETKTAPATRVTAGNAQDETILQAIRSAGYNPLQLPRNQPGKPGVKAEIRMEVVGGDVFPKVGRQFDKAWERLRARGDISDA